MATPLLLTVLCAAAILPAAAEVAIERANGSLKVTVEQGASFERTSDSTVVDVFALAADLQRLAVEQGKKDDLLRIEALANLTAASLATSQNDISGLAGDIAGLTSSVDKNGRDVLAANKDIAATNLRIDQQLLLIHEIVANQTEIANSSSSGLDLLRREIAVLQKDVNFAVAFINNAQLGTSRNPGQSCAQIRDSSSLVLRDGIYVMRDSSGATFNVRCDFSRDQGGWTKVLHSKDLTASRQWVPGSTGAKGDAATASTAGFAKLSDAQINSVANTGSLQSIYRFESTCTTNRLFLRTTGLYNDDVTGMGLVSTANGQPLGGVATCVTDDYQKCDLNGLWKLDAAVYVVATDVNGPRGFDLYTAYGNSETCDRWFSGHVGSGTNSHDCYPSSSSFRCFNAGRDCACGGQARYAVMQDFVLSVRPVKVANTDPSLKGLSASFPGLSCKELFNLGHTGSALYYLQPTGVTKPFQAFCDQSDGGGWLKIIQGAGVDYMRQWTPAQAGKAVGSIATLNIAPFSKFDDDTINKYLGSVNVFKYTSSCSGNNFYVKTFTPFKDSVLGMNIGTGANEEVCIAPTTSRCGFRGGQAMYRVNAFDNYQDYGGIETCDRWFQGHLSGFKPFSCYSPIRRVVDGQRCFSAGSNCRCGQASNYAVHQNLVIYAKAFADL